MNDRQDTDKRHKLMAHMDSKKIAPVPSVDLSTSEDYPHGLEAGRAETQAAVAAALMQAVEMASSYMRVGGFYLAESHAYTIGQKISALITPGAMAALEAERAKARKVKPLVWYQYETHPHKLWRAYCEALSQEWIIWVDCPDVAAEKAKVETERAARILAALEGGE